MLAPVLHMTAVLGFVIICNKKHQGDWACHECWQPEPICWVRIEANDASRNIWLLECLWYETGTD